MCVCSIVELENNYSEKNRLPGEKPEGCKSIIVKNCPYSMDEDDIWEMFEFCGEILRINALKNEDGSMKGMFFVDFSTTEATDEAVKKCNEEVGGRNIYVDFSAPPQGEGRQGQRQRWQGQGQGQGKRQERKGDAREARKEKAGKKKPEGRQKRRGQEPWWDRRIRWNSELR